MSERKGFRAVLDSCGVNGPGGLLGVMGVVVWSSMNVARMYAMYAVK